MKKNKDRPVHVGPLRHIPIGGAIVEITVRTTGGRFLFRPGDLVNRRLLGALGRAMKLHPEVKLYIYWFLSNHFNLYAFFPDALTMSRFMQVLNSRIALEMGRIHEWEERVMGRRYASIPSFGENTQENRFEYALSQGTKEGLVEKALDWPGASALLALLTGTPDVGEWIDYTKLGRKRRAARYVPESECAEEYPIVLSKLPAWEHLSDDEYRAKVAALVETIEAKAAEKNRELDRRPPGPEWILRQDPRAYPPNFERKPKPLCHADTLELARAYRDVYQAFVLNYRAATIAARTSGEVYDAAKFPVGCFLPSSVYVEGARASRAPPA